MANIREYSFPNPAAAEDEVDERDEQSSLLPKNGLSPHENHSYGAWNAAHEDGRRSESAVMHSMSAPSSTGIPDDGTNNWKMPIDLFTSKKKGENIKYFPSKKVRSFYRAQDELISSFENIYFGFDDTIEDKEVSSYRNITYRLTLLSFLVNMVLLAAKMTASILSGSISIISSLVDSVVDILSSIVLWWAMRATRKRNPYSYPQGRTKLEPVAVVVLSVIMSVASIQLVRESVQILIGLFSDPNNLPNFEITTIVIAASTVGSKFILWIICRRVESPTIQALAQDHRNDVLSNSVAIVCGYLGSQEFKDQTGYTQFIYSDPIGAMLISLYIIANWWSTGMEQVKVLTGISASPEFLAKLTWLTINHSPNIKYVETVQAYHFGNNCLVEVDIVLPKHIHLHTAHDIGESLQRKLETLPEVERAFVHVDYDLYHHPTTEHKIV
ncbi:hypothetical protein C0Q70_04004 [Pomacea canaliculata]|uniref:Uncharacterized protein n=1 Tax=Pomacea canaliculata TaxID=400727 RepID=A0A2T7PUB5_POMCA|nr:metal tolerance protein 9-like [Pomacea canaliculata]PVD37011.1 hypothetical protein C0Q70_04004 [Pomacea canaliculata]